MSAPAFFVIGSPRSGTSLLRLMLTAHPEITVPPECGFAVWLFDKFGAWEHHQFSDPLCLQQFADAVLDTRKFETWGISKEEVCRSLCSRPVSNYADMCSLVYQAYAMVMGRPSSLIGDKNNFYLSHIDLLARMFPQSKFIHIVRDGRDVACSYREVSNLASDSPYRPQFPKALQEIAREWSSNVRLIRNSLTKLDSKRVIQIRYEELTTSPEAVLKNLCDFLNKHLHPCMLEFHLLNASEGLEPTATLDWKRRTLTPVSPATVGRYKMELSSSEVKAFEIRAGQELRQYGYALN